VNVIPLKTLHELFDHNYWARDRQLAVCATLDADDFARPMGNSFPSVRETLAHLVWAEWLWLGRWEGRSPQVLSLAAELPTLDAIAGRWRVVERDVRRYLSGVTEEALPLPLTYVNSRGETWTYPLWRTMLHLPIHQASHRGQISTMLRQLGVSAPTVDFLMAHDMGFVP
jgi:uncharacterized damage-inducible protein DinB